MVSTKSHWLAFRYINTFSDFLYDLISCHALTLFDICRIFFQSECVHYCSDAHVNDILREASYFPLPLFNGWILKALLMSEFGSAEDETFAGVASQDNSDLVIDVGCGSCLGAALL